MSVLDFENWVLTKETDLILVGVIEWTVDVFLDRKMECSDSLYSSI